MVCTYKGVTFVAVAPGVSGDNYDSFIAHAFTKYPSKWRICFWHKNQRLMQVGTKGDETGWPVYEECRRHGAIILTGHEHVYARSWEMSSFVNQDVSGFHATYDKPTTLRAEVEEKGQVGTSLVLLSGTGGYGVRAFGQEVNNPWWAAAQAFETGLVAGAVICKFNVNGEQEKALCQYKSAYGDTVLDEFWLKTSLKFESLGDAILLESDKPTFIRIQISDGNDDVVQGGGMMFCSTKSIDLGTGLIPTGLVPVTAAFRFTGVPLTADDAPYIDAAYIVFTIHQNSRNGAEAGLNITSENTGDSGPLCVQSRLEWRTWSSKSVEWNNIQSWDGKDENYRPGLQTESPDLTELVRDIISRPDWRSGNAMTFFVTGEGTRAIHTFDSNQGCDAPQLVVEVANKCKGETSIPCFVENGVGVQSCNKGHMGKCEAISCLPWAHMTNDGMCEAINFSGNMRHSLSNNRCIVPKTFDDKARDGSKLALGTDCASDHAQFSFTQGGPIVHVATGKCLRHLTINGEVADGSNLILFKGCDSASLEYEMTSDGLLIHKLSGKCVNIQTDDNSNSLLVLDASCNPANGILTFSTVEPTTGPTNRPTGEPTPLPTWPTRAPTKEPTKWPTNRPTTALTRYPTNQPTNRPTRGPTLDPTAQPTRSPTEPPTQRPTNSPTYSPTRQPTKRPTRSPTEGPTAQPTSPTPRPIVPTMKPTNTPTSAPIPEPTRFPTKAPSQRPTRSPTPEPSNAPTNEPTPKPTRFPTRRPTSKPTYYPTSPPTNTPATTPSVSASMTPTRFPTIKPTSSPTDIPTKGPTQYPTPIPSNTPTQRPTSEVVKPEMPPSPNQVSPSPDVDPQDSIDPQPSSDPELVPVRITGRYQTQFTITIIPLNVAEFAKKEMYYRRKIGAITGTNPKQVLIVGVNKNVHTPEEHSRRLLQQDGVNEDTVVPMMGVDVKTSISGLDEDAATIKALLMKNAMTNGGVKANLLDIFPNAVFDFVHTEQPRVVTMEEPAASAIVSAAQITRQGSGSVLKGRMTYSWAMDSEGYVEISVTGHTTGWIGFGFAASSDGYMVGADVIIGRMVDGKLRVGDYIVGGKREASCPDGVCMDLHQPNGKDDIISWTGSFEERMTSMTFKRKVRTDDSDDIPIVPGRMTVILAMGTTSELNYHGANKASTVINFFDPPKPAAVSLLQNQVELAPDHELEPVLLWSLSPERDMLTFSLQIKTDGYAAIGFSPTGKMLDSYAVGGWQNEHSMGHVTELFLGGRQKRQSTMVCSWTTISKGVFLTTWEEYLL